MRKLPFFGITVFMAVNVGCSASSVERNDTLTGAQTYSQTPCEGPEALLDGNANRRIEGNEITLTADTLSFVMSWDDAEFDAANCDSSQQSHLCNRNPGAVRVYDGSNWHDASREEITYANGRRSQRFVITRPDLCGDGQLCWYATYQVYVETYSKVAHQCFNAEGRLVRRNLLASPGTITPEVGSIDNEVVASSFAPTN